MNYIDDMRTKVSLNEHGIDNVHTTDFPGTYYGYDDRWNFNKFKSNFRIDIIELKNNEMEFDMVGIDAAIANAFRRILLAEVPTMAVDKILIKCNTSVIPDEVLAHRIGLIPLNVDARLFEFQQEPDANELKSNEALVFDLNITCTKNSDAPKEVTDPNILLKNFKVYSGDIKWRPLNAQKDLLTDVKPLYNDILIAKLRPGQVIDMEMHAVKGLGKDHAKFSPVATASYRLLPEIKLTKSITGKTAKKLKKCFSRGVIDLIENENGEKEARVVNARRDACSREVLRHNELKDLVKLGKVRDHFIFNVESVSGVGPDVLVLESIKVLMSKCRNFIKALDMDTEPMETDDSV